MFTKNEITDAVAKLQKRLTDPGIVAPIYVRFRTNGQNIIIPVNNLSYDVDSIIADNHVINCGNVTSIEALCDSKRNPVFLNDYDDKGELDRVEEMNTY